MQDALLSLVPLAEAARVAGPAKKLPTRTDLWMLAATVRGSHGEETEDEHGHVVRFVQAVEALAAQFGLDRLGDDGRAQILAWCSRYIRARRAGSPHQSTYGPDRLSTATLPFTWQPDPIGVIPPPWREETWDFMRERRVDARERLERRARAHIHAVLDQIEREARASGTIFPDTAPNLERDLDWLYKKVRHRKTYQEIYDSLRRPPAGGPGTVRGAVLRVAAAVGVDTSGWESGWR